MKLCKTSCILLCNSCAFSDYKVDIDLCSNFSIT